MPRWRRRSKRSIGDRTDEFAGLLAHHYEAAGRLAEAANQAARAARWVGTTNPAQAIKHWHQVRVLLRTLERAPDSDGLRAMASGQIAMLGWREGMPAEEARGFVEEAIGWARELDPSMVQLLLATDGRITVASGGPVDTYIARLNEALALDPQGIDTGRIATLNVFLSQACNMAGLLEDALAASDHALARDSLIRPSDHQFVGFNMEHWVGSLRGRILVRLGRFAEAERQLDEMLRIEPILVDPTIQFIPHFGYVELAWCRADAALAEDHASRVAAIAEAQRHRLSARLRPGLQRHGEGHRAGFRGRLDRLRRRAGVCPRGQGGDGIRGGHAGRPGGLPL